MKSDGQYEAELGELYLIIEPSTEKGLYQVRVKKGYRGETIGESQNEISGLDKAKDLAYDIAGDYYKQYAGGGGVGDEKFFHESRLLDYGFSKDIDSAGNRIYEKGLYKIVINPKDKTYTAILNGRPETHKIYDKKFALGRFIDLEFGTKYAKGGMTEHGLEIGDEIMGYTKKVNELHVVNRKNNDEWHSVDLDDGKRYAGGGGISGLNDLIRG